MPHSDAQGKDVALSWYREIGPATVVDVGAGSGTYARLMRTVQDDEDRWYEHVTPDGERVQTSVRDKWRAIEAWQPYLDEFTLIALYDEILVADARDVEPDTLKADLVIFGDVLEHMTRQEARDLLAKARQVAGNIIVSIPVLHLDQDDVGGNPYERHVEHWSYEDMRAELAPGLVKTWWGDVLAHYWWAAERAK